MSYKFKPELYFRPRSINEATEMLARYGKEARIIAGGTDLLVDKPEAKILVDINGLDLSYVKTTDSGVTIGATTCFNNLANSPPLQEQPHKVVSDAARKLGHYNLRHMATVGGNICNAVPSADSPVALMALDAAAIIVGPTGERTVPLEGFFRFVRETALCPGELLKELVIPHQPRNTAASFQKIGRTKVDIAIVNAACRLTVEDGTVENVRIILGAVAPTPLRALEAEKILNGREVTAEIVEKAAKRAADESSPIDDVRSSASYRREMSKVVVRRAVMDAYGRALEVSA